MESITQASQVIKDAKNICLIGAEKEPKDISAALALFYTLKELGKNVNLIADSLPESFHFLAPSLEFLSLPKNFVISIPRKAAEISQVYYEKNDDNLKIHLTINKGIIKKEDISFYFSQPKPDIVITVGISDFHKELSSKLDSFGFLIDSPIINIDKTAPALAGNPAFGFARGKENTKFGKINLVQTKSTAEIIFDLINSLDQNSLKKEGANCLLTSLIWHYNNFQDSNIGPEVFELCALLMKKGADRQTVLSHFFVEKEKRQNQKETAFGGAILEN